MGKPITSAHAWWAAADSGGPVGSRDGQITWPVRSGAVPSLAGGFSAREETAADLGAALVTGAVVVLVPDRRAGVAPGGWLEACGKTQLAVSVAGALWQSRRVELLVWIVATSRESVLSGLAEAAVDATGAPPGGDGEALAARFLGWLHETSRPWLVVFDGLADVADLEGLWPAGPTGRVLVTTSDPAACSGEQGALVHPVGVFSPHEAMSYLMSRLAADPDKRLGAIDLVGDLGYEPLALAQASAVIVSSAMSCRDYQDRFVRGRARAAEAAAAVTWAISAEHANALSPDGTAHGVLALASLLDGHGIPAAFFTAPAAREYLAAGDGEAATGEQARAALLTAERVGLLSVDHSNTVAMARMSGVVQVAVRAELAGQALEPAARAAADALAQVWPGDEKPAWLASALRSCAASLTAAAGELLWDHGCHPLLFRTGESLDASRLTGSAVAYWAQLSAMSNRILGRAHPDTLTASERLAGGYLRAGRAAEAVSRVRWVLTERVRVLGPEHPSAIAARLNLGRALMALHNYRDAVTVLDRAASDYERIRGLDQPDTLAARDELAAAHRAAGRYADAIGLYRQTLASRESLQGTQHPDTVTTRQRLADAYLADDRPKEAISHARRVLSDTERALGPDDLDTIAARGMLASAYQAAGRTAAALQLHEQTREGYERALGPEHPDTLASSAKLAHAYYAAGRVTDAVTMLRQTLALSERALPPGDPLTRAVRQSLANISGG
jgi:tetratricopeptide (TPR) repeat protein